FGQQDYERTVIFASPGMPSATLRRDYSYDSFGRGESVDTLISEAGQPDKNYQQSTVYDQYGRVFQQFDATGDNRGELFIYSPSTGYLESIQEARFGQDVLPYQTVLAMDARGNVIESILGNGTTVNNDYDPATGEVLWQSEQLVYDDEFAVYFDYVWDEMGRLIRRDDFAVRLNYEFYDYDAGHRLTESWHSSVGGDPDFNPQDWTLVQELRYNEAGNIEYKSDVCGSTCGSGNNYTYGEGSAGPHAVTSVDSYLGDRTFQYDANGNLTTDLKNGQSERTFQYTTFNKVMQLDQQLGGAAPTRQSEFYYGPDRARFIQRNIQGGAIQSRTHYVGGVEFEYEGSTVDIQPNARRSVAGLVLQTIASNGYEQTFYQHRDHLGSLVALSTQSGRIEARMGFDAWGNRRDPALVEPPWWHWSTPNGLSALAWSENMLSHTPRGFTGHEHLDWHGVIHMNGRIYDPFLARFLQADPFMEDTGTLNRYTYVFNNPLAYSDPSGYLRLKEFGRIALAVGISVYTGGVASGTWGIWAGTTVGTGKALTTVAIGAVLSNRVATGSWNGSATAAFTAMAFYGVGQGIGGAEWAKGDFIGDLSGPGLAAKTVSHGLIGGISAELQGGQFGHGFLSSGVTAAASPYIHHSEVLSGNRFLQGLTAAMVGGTVSELTGGKFANGAVTSAMAFAFNELASRADSNSRSTEDNFWTHNSSDAVGPHGYMGAEKVCGYLQTNCTVENFKSDYGLWHSAPGQTNPVGNGVVNYLPAFGGGGPLVWPVSHELEYFNVPAGVEAPFMRTANITLPGHPLAGTVNRYYIARSDGIYVNTIGSGYINVVPVDGPPMSYFNNSLGVRVFSNLNNNLREAVGN
ncbi:MAG: RHS repeat-associated core domain-containing protein, partial [Pseudomonadota bacterium]